MMLGRVTPTSGVVGLSKVRWTEISGGDKNGWVSGKTPAWIIDTFELKASPTAQTIVE